MGVQCRSRCIATVLGLLLACVPATQAAPSPIFYFPGMMVSNLTASISAAGACTQARRNVQLWPPQVSELLAGRDCWYQSIRLDFEGGRFVNGTGAEVWAEPFTTLASVPASLQTWVAEIQNRFPIYKYGVNLFIMAYDWRLDVNSMAQTGQLQQLAQAILDKTDSSNRAILIGHSQGALVATQLLQLPDVGELASLIPPELLDGVKLPFPGADALVREVTWNAVKGMASLAMLLPYNAAYENGIDALVVRAGSDAYIVSRMPILLRDLGDRQLVNTFDQTHTLDKLVASGPIPGVDVYCMYGIDISTVKQLVYNVTLSNSIAPLPWGYLYARGDSVVTFTA
ncbi:hypothetical protein COO60DRAFT_1701449 [Scenedesmus sp. NREL 46B-D3]|nr:hypothetical protein COO60DRAFT_1701449 [Scenedesmus sp. NREL 46B-D3]